MSDLDQIAVALVAFQCEMPTVPKAKRAEVPTKTGGKYTYTYADLADVTEAAMPILSKHGLAFVALPNRTEGGSYELVGTLLHTSGQTLTAALPLSGGTEQTMGSSLTYQRRYLLGCMTGLVTDDDEDGQIASAPRKKPAARQAPPPEREPGRTSEGNGISPAQLGKIGALMSELGIKERAEALGYVAAKVGRPVDSRNDLSKSEAHVLIEALEADKATS